MTGIRQQPVHEAGGDETIEFVDTFTRSRVDFNGL